MWEGFRYLGTAGALSLAVGLPLAMSVTGALGSVDQYPPGSLVLIIAAPWNGGASAIVAQTDGRIIGPEQTALAAYAVFETPVSQDQLQALGAWVTTDGRRLAAICGVTLDG